MTDIPQTPHGSSHPSDEELFDYVQGTLAPERRAEVAQAIEQDPSLRELITRVQSGSAAVRSYGSARMPMDSAVALHRALGSEWLEREEQAHQKASPTRQRPSKAPKPRSRTTASRSGGPWWRSPGFRVAISFAAVALVAGFAVTGLRSATDGSNKQAPSLADAPVGQDDRSAAPENIPADQAPTSDSPTAGAESAPAATPTESAPITTPSGLGQSATEAPASQSPELSQQKSQGQPTETSEVLCVFVSSSVPIPVAGPANPVLGNVKRSLSADFTIAPYRIDCKF